VIKQNYLSIYVAITRTISSLLPTVQHLHSEHFPACN